MRISRYMLAAVGLLMVVLAVVVGVVVANYEPDQWTSDGTRAFIGMGSLFAPVLAAIGVATAGIALAIGTTTPTDG